MQHICSRKQSGPPAAAVTLLLILQDNSLSEARWAQEGLPRNVG